MLHYLAANFYYSLILLPFSAQNKSYNLNGYKWLYKYVIFIEIKLCGGKHSFEVFVNQYFTPVFFLGAIEAS